MKREIKFRAWCRDGEWDEAGEKMAFRMIDAESLAFTEYEPLVDSLKDKDDEMYLMQFAGLADKNGKEIYEGDIVKSHDAVWDNTPLETGGEPDMVFKEVIGAVEYRGRGFWITGESFGWEGEEMWNWDDLEIIGNIYENPELINPI